MTSYNAHITFDALQAVHFLLSLQAYPSLPFPCLNYAFVPGSRTDTICKVSLVIRVSAQFLMQRTDNPKFLL